MPLRTRIIAGFILVCVLWGTSWAVVRVGLETIPPLLSLGIRFLIASVVLGCIQYSRHLPLPRDRTFRNLVLVVFGSSFTVPFIMIYWAQLEVDSGLAAVLFATFPFWVALLSHVVLPGERLTLPRIFGIAVGFGGILLIFHDSVALFPGTQVVRFVAIVAAAVIQAGGLVVLRKAGDGVHPVTLNFSAMTLSAVVLLLLSAFFEKNPAVTWNAASISSLVYLSLGCTVTTFVIYFWLIKHVEAVVLSLSAFITPVLAVGAGMLFLKEHMTWQAFLGSALVLSGVVLASAGDLFASAQKEVRT